MEKLNLNQMSRQAKIDLLKSIAKQEISIVDGFIIENQNSAVLFRRNGVLYFDNECTETVSEQVASHIHTAIILPPRP